jgi:hypothetical protein
MKKVPDKFFFYKNNIINATYNIDSSQLLKLQCYCHLIYPDYLLFFDATGGNNNQKKDEHNGGKKLVCSRGTTSKLMFSTSNKHLPYSIIASTGETGLYVSIFASKKRRCIHQLGSMKICNN